jgi:hypothetical protein
MTASDLVGLRSALGSSPVVRPIAKRHRAARWCSASTRSRGDSAAPWQFGSGEGKVTANRGEGRLPARSRGYGRTPNWIMEVHCKAIMERYTQWQCTAMGCNREMAYPSHSEITFSSYPELWSDSNLRRCLHLVQAALRQSQARPPIQRSKLGKSPFWRLAHPSRCENHND